MHLYNGNKYIFLAKPANRVSIIPRAAVITYLAAPLLRLEFAVRRIFSV